MRPWIAMLGLLACGLANPQQLKKKKGPGVGPPPAFREQMAQYGHGPGNLKPGDLAPEFRLKEKKSGKEIALSQFRNKVPVALVFGSYT